MDSDQSSQQPSQPPGKYRSSCDACQSSKVRCSQEKPSCRRCTTQDVECVYSLSRRMGRPRQKSKDTSRVTETTETLERSTEGTKAMAPARAVANSTVAYEEDTIAVVNNRGESNNASGQSVAGSSRDDSSGSPLMHDNNVPSTTLDTSFMDDMNLDGIFTSEMLDFAAFRDVPVPNLSIDCAESAMDLDVGFTQMLGLGTSGVAAGGGSMFGIDPSMGFGLGEIPSMAPATPLSPAESALGASGAARGAGKPRPSNLNRILTSARFDCACYSNVLRLIASSQAHQHSNMAITIDSILGLEDDTKHMLSDLLTCPNCHRDPCVQLLAIVSFSTTLKLLRHAANNKLKPPNQRRSSTYIAPPTSSTAMQDCTLYVGKFKVTDEMRAGFVRQIFSVRMGRLLAELEGVFSNLKSLPQGAMSSAAITVAYDMYNELQTITGLIELWN